MANSNLLRLFIGIKITPSSEIWTALRELKQQLSESEINWVKQENYHITLKFLGETPEYYINSIDIIIQQILYNIHKFDIELKGCDFFGKKSPQIIWIGLHQVEKLIFLQRMFNKSLQELGFTTETKAFIPHLTIGRIKKLKSSNSNFVKIIEKTSVKIIKPIEIKQVDLIQSKLEATGPVYKSIKSYPLYT
jgi:2'-5' RNA ligase